MFPGYELGLDRVFQAILGLSNPVVSNSCVLLSNLHNAVFRLGIKYFMLEILNTRSFIISVIFLNILLFHVLTFVIFFI